jgi:hypothetical protein
VLEEQASLAGGMKEDLTVVSFFSGQQNDWDDDDKKWLFEMHRKILFLL